MYAFYWPLDSATRSVYDVVWVRNFQLNGTPSIKTGVSEMTRTEENVNEKIVNSVAIQLPFE